MNDTATGALALGVIAITGADAAEFLRAQVTTDIADLPRDGYGLTAWCDARGNTLAIFYLMPVADGYYAITSDDLIDGLIQRLRMYVLRAQVDVTDLRADYTVIANRDAVTPAAGARRDEGHTIHLGLRADNGSLLTLMIRPRETGRSSAPINMLDTNAFELARIDAGVPAVNAITRASFVPQMLNLHWLAALDFDKGCFPGQEVIARLQNRGRLTQRVYRYRWQGVRPAIGDDVFDAEDHSRGTVIRTAGLAASDDDEGRLLAVVKTSAAADAGLHTESARLEPLELPYPTPADVRPAVHG